MHPTQDYFDDQKDISGARTEVPIPILSGLEDHGPRSDPGSPAELKRTADADDRTVHHGDHKRTRDAVDHRCLLMIRDRSHDEYPVGDLAAEIREGLLRIRLIVVAITAPP